MTVVQSAPPAQRTASSGRLSGSGAVVLVRLAGVAAILLLWYLLGVFGVLHTSSIPTLGSTLTALAGAAVHAHFWLAVWHTIEGWAIGLVFGAVAGVLLGSLLALSRVAERSCTVVVEFFKTVPVVAVLPLAVLVLGTTVKMKILLVAFGVTWPLLVQTMYGVKALDPVIRDTATVIGMGRLRRFFGVVMPSAAPYIATGLRVAAAGALILTIVTELIVGGSGLGVEITTAAISGTEAIPTMYAYILAAGALGIAVTLLFSAAERRLLRWHEAYR